MAAKEAVAASLENEFNNWLALLCAAAELEESREVQLIAEMLRQMYRSKLR